MVTRHTAIQEPNELCARNDALLGVAIVTKSASVKATRTSGIVATYNRPSRFLRSASRACLINKAQDSICAKSHGDGTTFSCRCVQEGKNTPTIPTDGFSLRQHCDSELVCPSI